MEFVLSGKTYEVVKFLGEGKLVYIDYACNVYDERWDFEHWGNDYWWKSPVFFEYVESHK